MTVPIGIVVKEKKIVRGTKLLTKIGDKMIAKINYKKASQMWGGVHPGYWVSKEELLKAKEDSDTVIIIIPVGNGYEIDSIILRNED